MNYFRPGGLNPSIAAAFQLGGNTNCVAQAQALLKTLPGFNQACDPAPANGFSYTGCIPFGDMDANYSNGSSVYHGLTANLRKRFSNHYELLASYTWSHAIDDSTDLQSTLTPQDSYYPGLDRSNSTFDERHRFVFSGVYQSGRLSGDGFAEQVLQRLDTCTSLSSSPRDGRSTSLPAMATTFSYPRSPDGRITVGNAD